MAKVAGAVHGIKAAVGRGIKKVGDKMGEAGRPFASGLPTGNAEPEQLIPEQVQALAQQLRDELLQGIDATGLEGLDQFLDDKEVPDEGGAA